MCRLLDRSPVGVEVHTKSISVKAARPHIVARPLGSMAFCLEFLTCHSEGYEILSYRC